MRTNQQIETHGTEYSSYFHIIVPSQSLHCHCVIRLTFDSKHFPCEIAVAFIVFPKIVENERKELKTPLAMFFSSSGFQRPAAP